MTNLKLWPTSPAFPQFLTSLQHLVEKLTRPGIRNIFIDDELRTHTTQPGVQKGKGVPPSQHITDAFLQDPSEIVSRSVPRLVHTLSYTTYNGIRYTTQTRHAGNSRIVVLSPAREKIPMIVQEIIQDADTGRIFIAARRLKPIVVKEDPFRAYPILGAEIWGHWESLSSKLEILVPSEIDCQFASCDTSTVLVDGDVVECSIIVPLPKVSFILCGSNGYYIKHRPSSWNLVTLRKMGQVRRPKTRIMKMKIQKCRCG